MKWMTASIAWAGVIWATHYLYNHQLGSIPFLLLSFYFIMLAVKNFKKNKQLNKSKPLKKP